MCKLLHGKDNVCCGVYWQPPLVQGFSRLQLTGAGLFKTAAGLPSEHGGSPQRPMRLIVGQRDSAASWRRRGTPCKDVGNAVLQAEGLNWLASPLRRHLGRLFSHSLRLVLPRPASGSTGCFVMSPSPWKRFRMHQDKLEMPPGMVRCTAGASARSAHLVRAASASLDATCSCSPHSTASSSSSSCAGMDGFAEERSTT